MPDLLLTGCSTLPLGSYLKGLGVLRLVAEQLDPEVRASWTDRGLRLTASVDEQRVLSFFLEHYRPTPLLAPWNAPSGFYYKWDAAKQQFKERDACDVVETFANATHPRLSAYASAIAAIRAELERLSRTIDPASCSKKELDEFYLLKGSAESVRAIARVDKGTLLKTFRACLPDQVVAWLDAAFVLGEDGQAALPLLGSGGNDGNLDFSIVAMRNLRAVVALDKAAPLPRESPSLLRWALLADVPVPLVEDSPGQFDPGGFGGPNSAQGFAGRSLVNPWDIVLAFEGALLFAGAAVRRFNASGTRAAFPFSVTPIPAGDPTLAVADMAKSRGELWMPIWSRSLAYREVRALIGEGRAQLGRAQAQTGVDFARAVASLGVDRGVDEFQRFGILKRAGRMFIAAPLGRYRVRGASRAVRLADEIESWLSRARAAQRTGRMPARFTSALRSVDDAIYELARTGADDYWHAEKLIRAVGRLAQTAATSRQVQESLSPLCGLSRRWVEACGPGPEPRLALALASLGSPPIRTNVEPVEITGSMVKWQDRSPSVVWRGRILERDLADVLERRIIDAVGARLKHEGRTRWPGGETEAVESPARQGHPLTGTRETLLEDVAAFLTRDVDDHRLSDLLWTFLALEPDALSAEPMTESAPAEGRSLNALPRQYVLLKFVLSPSLSRDGERVSLPLSPELVRLIRTNLPRAVELAVRRLRVTGLPVFTPGPGMPRRALHFLPGDIDPDRLAAALLLPVWRTHQLRRLLLAPDDGQQETFLQEETS